MSVGPCRRLRLQSGVTTLLNGNAFNGPRWTFQRTIGESDAHSTGEEPHMSSPSRNNAGSGIVFSGPKLREYRGTLLAFRYALISGMVVD